MTIAAIDRLCDAVSAAAMMGHLQEFAKRVKLSGTPEELASFRYIEERLAAYGFTTDLIEHDADISLPGKARLMADGRGITCARSSPRPLEAAPAPRRSA